MGAVDAIEQHHEAELERRRRLKEQAQAAAAAGGQAAGEAAAAAVAQEAEHAPEEGAEGKPDGYPGEALGRAEAEQRALLLRRTAAAWCAAGKPGLPAPTCACLPTAAWRRHLLPGEAPPPGGGQHADSVAAAHVGPPARRRASLSPLRSAAAGRPVRPAARLPRGPGLPACDPASRRQQQRLPADPPRPRRQPARGRRSGGALGTTLPAAARADAAAGPAAGCAVSGLACLQGRRASAC